MAKKNFTDSAAAELLQDLMPEPETPAPKPAPKKAAKAKKQETPEDAQKNGGAIQLDLFDKEARQKRAKRNATYKTQILRAPMDHPEGYEARTRRVNLLMKPSLYDAAFKKAKKMGISFNHLTELLIQAYLKQEGE